MSKKLSRTKFPNAFENLLKAMDSFPRTFTHTYACTILHIISEGLRPLSRDVKLLMLKLLLSTWQACAHLVSRMVPLLSA